MPASDGIEVEWQFGVGDLAAAERALRACAGPLGLELAPSGTRVLRDEYLDTDDWSFHRAGFALRLREADAASADPLTPALSREGRGSKTTEATLKGFGETSDGPRRRREINEALDGGGREALLAAPGPVARRVRAVAGPREVRALFALRTERRTFELRAEGSPRPVAEAAFDATEVETGGSPPRVVRRVELEVADPAALASVERLAAALGAYEGFERASASKFALGLAASGLTPPGPPDLGPTRVDACSTLGEVAYAALRGQFARFVVNEPGARLGEDAEALHDMRVATRRLRTALDVFADALPPETIALRPEFRRVADALGEVRDLDVQLAWLRAEAASADRDEALPLAPLIGVLDARRDEARERMLAVLDAPRHARLVETAAALLRAPAATPAGDAPAADAAPSLLRKRWRRFNRRARRLDAASPDDDHHAARIRAKRIRYAAEFTAALHTEPAAEFVAALKAVQDDLGRRQDTAAGVGLLERLAAEEPLPAATVFAMGRLAEREREAARDVGSSFPRAHRRARRAWRRLRRAMERAADA